MARQAIAYSYNEQRSKPLDAARLVNLFPEQPPLGARVPALTTGPLSSPLKSVLYGTPGLKLSQTLGTGKARASREALGYQWCLFGSTLYRIDSSGTTTACTGDAIPASGTAMMSDNGVQLAVLVGGQLYVVGSTNATASFTVTGGTLSAGANTISDVKVNSVTITNGAVDWSDTNEATAGAIAASINTKASSPDYTASTTGATVIIRAVTSGSGTNGFGVVIDLLGNVTITPTSTAMSGGATSSTTVQHVTDANFPAAGLSSIDYVDGYIVYTVAVSTTANRQWGITALFDATTFPSLDFATAESTPSDLLRVLVNYEEVVLFSKSGMSFWRNTGASPFPFERIPGAVSERGCAAALSPAKINGAVYWLGDDRKVYKAQNYQPLRISTHGLEEVLRKASTVSDAIGMTYSMGGHDFYVLTFPTLNRTFCWDEATQGWHERQSGTTITPAAWLVRWIAPAFTKIYAGLDSGQLCQLDMDTFTDAGNPIRRVAVTPPFYADGKRSSISTIELECELGMDTSSFYARTGVGSALSGSYTVNTVGAVTFSGINSPLTFPKDCIVFIEGYGPVNYSRNTLGTIQSLINGGYTGGPAVGTIIPNSTAVYVVDSSPNPQAMLRYSDDGGATWSNQRTASIGKVGARTARALFRRHGIFRQREYELSVSDAVNIAAYGIRFEPIRATS